MNGRSSRLEIFREKLTNLGVSLARPAAFVIWAIYVALWIAFDREAVDFHAVATMATWLMTLFIQRAGHRDTQAIHAKLDELLRSTMRQATNSSSLIKKSRRRSNAAALRVPQDNRRKGAPAEAAPFAQRQQEVLVAPAPRAHRISPGTTVVAAARSTPTSSRSADPSTSIGATRPRTSTAYLLNRRIAMGWGRQPSWPVGRPILFVEMHIGPS